MSLYYTSINKWLNDYEGYKEKVSDDLESNDARVLRGGSWIEDNLHSLFSSYRDSHPPGGYYSNVGFRVVCVRGSAR